MSFLDKFRNKTEDKYGFSDDEYLQIYLICKLEEILTTNINNKLGTRFTQNRSFSRKFIYTRFKSKF